MAATVTLTQLKARALRRADMVSGDGFVDTTTSGGELETYIQEGGRELYDLVLKYYGEDYYYSSAAAVTVAGTATVALPSDFYKLLGVDAVLPGYTDPVPLDRFNWNERHNEGANSGWSWANATPRYRLRAGNLYFIPTPQAVHSLTVHYVPAMPAISDAAPFDGINGWDEYIVLSAAIKMLAKEESDTSALQVELERCRRRIEEMAPARDVDKPLRVTDIMDNADFDWNDL